MLVASERQVWVPKKVPWGQAQTHQLVPPDSGNLLLVLAPHRASAGSAGAFMLSAALFGSGIPGVWLALCFFILGDATLRQEGWLRGGDSRRPDSLWGQTYIL